MQPLTPCALLSLSRSDWEAFNNQVSMERILPISSLEWERTLAGHLEEKSSVSYWIWGQSMASTAVPTAFVISHCCVNSSLKPLLCNTFIDWTSSFPFGCLACHLRQVRSGGENNCETALKDDISASLAIFMPVCVHAFTSVRFQSPACLPCPQLLLQACWNKLASYSGIIKGIRTSGCLLAWP